MATKHDPSPVSQVGPPIATNLSTDNKRKRHSIVRVACNACRMKKTRCDGRRPQCGWCASHPGSHCVYDTESAGETRASALKRENTILKENLDRAERLLYDLTSLPEPQSLELLKRIRGGDALVGGANSSAIRDPVEPRIMFENAHSNRNLPSIANMQNDLSSTTRAPLDARVTEFADRPAKADGESRFAGHSNGSQTFNFVNKPVLPRPT